MLGELIIRVLELILGYLYPALQCFKAIEIRGPGPDSLLFWCRYWVIIAAVTALEKFGDLFVSWVPLYGEAKLAFIVFLWHPKTKGTSYVFDAAVRPFMAQHEPDIEKRLLGMMAKTAQVLAFYIRHFTDKGQSIALNILDRVITRPPPPPLISDAASCSSEAEEGNFDVFLGAMMPFDQPPIPSGPPKRRGGGGLFKRWRRKKRDSNIQVNTPTMTTTADADDNEVDERVREIQEVLRAVGVELPPPQVVPRQ